jgi:hypothetical protein
MTKNLKVKVIKKDARVTAPAAAKPEESPKIAAREMVSTVATWVSEFQQRKSVETKTAIKKFFAQPQPNES